MHKAIGKTTIKIGKPMKITNQEIKEARSNRKTQKIISRKSLKAKNPTRLRKQKTATYKVNRNSASSLRKT